MNSFQIKIDKIKANREDGSLQILKTTIDVILNYLTSEGFSRAELDNQITSVSKNFPDFAVLQHFISGLRSSGNTKKELLDFISDYKIKWNHVDRDISKHFLNNIDLNGSTILLHSNSRTIHTLFEEIARKKLSVNVLQTESQPGGEGELQAEYIGKLGFKVIVIKDNDVKDHLNNIDMFLIGADRIEPENIINKVGSMVIAETFYEVEKPVYVLADSRKIIDSEWPVKSELFEKVPRELITGVVTEKGLSSVI